ncbi:RlpA-like double-psi beta-barrel-protein domain-containing protein-containing protein [Cladorrhinum sp. PSN259]|nr:RlpA-like double-psi beta-barrel-protein domain-containing protein-containing protein [Cladorrhinum sp. PSN259]
MKTTTTTTATAISFLTLLSTLAAAIPITTVPAVPDPNEVTITSARSSNCQQQHDTNTKHNTYRGHMTYYDVGPGACGHDDSGKGGSHNIVALSAALMPSSGGGKMCGRKISIKGGNGKEVTATVRDKCPSCPKSGIDVSEKVFREIAGDLGLGRTEVEWSFV